MTADVRGLGYEFVLRGEIGDRFGVLFEDMRLQRIPGHTVLTGIVLDQAHLHGLIERIQELGIELVSVNPLHERTDARGRTMSTAASTPDTIVLIHGFWVTPRSWEHWITHYEARGYRVLAPAYPGFEVEVEALNADPAPIEAVTVPQIIERLETVVGELDSPPILIGHSAGGVFTQVLLDHGFGAAGVAINSAPTEGVAVVPLSQVKATFPVLKNPANRHRAVGFTHEQWHYAFTNTLSEEESRALYVRYHIPASGSIFWGSALANIHPGHDDNYVDYGNDDRAPLLFISGSEDHLMPPKIQRSNAKHYKSATLTEVKEFEGPHLLPAAPGWEEVADYALAWAVDHAGQRSAA
jgi:pimeloyl-ACP methyl ester carboxylesterase